MLSYLRTALFTRTSSALSLSWFSTTASSSAPSQAQLKAMSVKDLVEKAITDNQIAIFSKSYCPYCKRAKQLIKDNYPGAKSVVFELDEMDEGTDIQNYLYEKTGQRTVPNVFVGQQHIGGCDKTELAHKNNAIAPLLK